MEFHLLYDAIGELYFVLSNFQIHTNGEFKGEITSKSNSLATTNSELTLQYKSNSQPHILSKRITFGNDFSLGLNSFLCILTIVINRYYISPHKQSAIEIGFKLKMEETFNII